MLIAVTLVATGRQHDLHLPAEVPIAVLRDDLQRLTDLADPVLSAVGGNRLDDEKSLLGNGVRNGAILQISADDAELLVLDDVTDVVRRPEPPAGIELRALATVVLLTSATSCLLSTEALHPTAGIVALVGSLSVGIAPRAVARLLALTPDADPEDPGVRARAGRAGDLTALIASALGLLAVTAGTALVAHGGLWSVVAGWVCVLLVLVRFSTRSRLVTVTALAMSALGASYCLRDGSPVMVVIGCAGSALCLGIVAAARPGGSPVARLAVERAGVLLTLSLPALLLLAFDLAPVPWS